MVYVDGACLKHSRHWRSRSEWIINELRKLKKEAIQGNNLKVAEFVTAFLNLLCTCDEDGRRKPQLKEINDEIWRTLSADDLRASVTSLRNYGGNQEIVKMKENLLQLLYGHQALSDQNPEQNLKGALRLTYMVWNVITQDFQLFLRYREELNRRQPQVHTLELDELPPDDLESFVHQGHEPNGCISKFNQEHQCEVTFKKKKKGGDRMIVSAKIVKIVPDVSAFTELEQKLKDLVRGLQTEAKEMEVDTNVSAVQTGQGAVPNVPSVVTEQQQLPQTSFTTQPFVPQTERMEVSASSQAPSQTRQNLDQPESCLVHSSQWMSTYQFILNQCISRNILEQVKGHDFSQKVCSCNANQDSADISQYFRSELDIQTKIRQVKDEIKSWRNGIIVMQRLIWEMEKEQAGSWQSLLKFVHEFLQLKASGRNGAPR